MTKHRYGLMVLVPLAFALMSLGFVQGSVVGFEVIHTDTGPMGARELHLAQSDGELRAIYDANPEREYPHGISVDFTERLVLGYGLGPGGCRFVTDSVHVEGQTVTLVVDDRRTEQQCPSIDLSYFELVSVARADLPTGRVRVRAVFAGEESPVVEEDVAIEDEGALPRTGATRAWLPLLGSAMMMVAYGMLRTTRPSFDRRR